MNNTENFIQKALKIHLNNYMYSNTKYINCKTKVIVTCRIHGDYLITPSCHLRGKGCAECGLISRANKRRLNTGTFIERATEVHKDTYDYSKVDYVDNSAPVTVVCKLHGDFETTLARHVDKGCGCPKCGIDKRSSTRRFSYEDFVKQAASLRSDMYNYSKVEYCGYHVKVTIGCKVHGDFKQTPGHHLNGKGCAKCSKYGYSKSRPGTFYILKAGNIIKVGITNRDVEFRIKSVSKTSGQTFNLVSSMYFENGEIPYKIEQQVLKFLSSKYTPVTEIFDGSTECFLNVDLTELLSFIHPLIQSETIVSH